MAEKYTYIYDMPYKVRQRLTDVLNVNDVWKDLAGLYLNYGQVIDSFRIQTKKNRPQIGFFILRPKLRTFEGQNIGKAALLLMRC